MKITENRTRWNLRKWIVPASLAAAMVVLPGAASTAEAHGPHHHAKKAHQRAHKFSHHGARHFAPVHVSYYRSHGHRHGSFYLESPYVVVHGPRINARVVYYPGDVPLYQSGYCPSAVHYHPYERDRHVDVHGRVNVNIGF